MFRPFIITTALMAAAFVHSTATAQTEIITLDPEPAVTPEPVSIDHVYTAAPDDHTLGSADAPVDMIIYASVTCGHCSDWFTNHWPTLKTDYIETGKVRVIFREFPTAPVGLAMSGFLIANCAANNGFFESIEHQMQTQKDIFKRVEAGDGRQAYTEIAEKAGIIGEEALLACFNEQAHEDRLNRALDRARASNTDSVPAFYINGERYRDDMSAEGLALKMNSLISASE